MTAASWPTLVGLTEKYDARIGTLSGGQLRRLDLALALVGRPEIVFLDEPTTGFDPEARRRSWDLIESLRDLGTTIVLTSHYMDEVERLADRRRGDRARRDGRVGSPADLGRARSTSASAFRLPTGVAPSDLPPLDGERVDVLEGRTVVVETLTPTELLHELTGWAMTAASSSSSLTVNRPSLEDVYLELTTATDGDE